MTLKEVFTLGGGDVTTTVKGTYGTTRWYRELDKLPKIGERFSVNEEDDARVTQIVNVNDEVAETTSGDPKEKYNFYMIYAMVYDVLEEKEEETWEYVAVERPSEAQRRAVKKYDKEHVKGVYLKLNKNTDKDILEKLWSVDKVQTYIKELIREDIKKSPR